MADGHIKISTAIDNTQAVDDFKQFERAIKEFADGSERKLNNSLSKMRNDYDKLYKKHAEGIRSISNLRNEIEDLNYTMAQHSSGKDKLNTQQYREVRDQLARANKELDKMLDSTAGLEVRMSGIRINASDQAKKLKDGATNAKSLDNNVRNAKKSSDNLGSSLKGGVRSLGKYALAMFSVRSAYVGISRMARNVINSNDEMGAKMRAQVESITNAFNNLFAPAVQVVLNLISSLVGALGTALKLMFGIDITTKKSSKNTDNMNKGMKGINKELKKQLAGFDEVEKLTKDVSSNLDGGSTGLDEIQISEPDVGFIKKIVDKLKADLQPAIDILTNLNFEPLKEEFKHLGNAVSELGKIFYQSFVNIMNDSVAPFIKIMTEDIYPRALHSIAEVLEMLAPHFEWFLTNLVEPFINWLLMDFAPVSWELFISTVDLLRIAVDKLLEGFEEFWTFIGPFASWLGDVLVLAFDGVRESIEETTRKIRENEDGYGDLFEMLGLVAGALSVLMIGSLVKSGIGIVTSTGLVTGLTKAFGLLWSIIKVVAGFFAGAFSGSILAIISLVGLLVLAIVGLVTNWEQTWKDMKVIGNNIKGIFQGIIDFVAGVFTGNWKRAFKGLADAVTNAFVGVVNAVKLPINMIVDGVNAVIRGLNKVKVPSWVPGIGGKGINLSQIPRLQRGTIVNRPMQAIIGDGGREAVIPLENDTRALEEIASLLNSFGGAGGDGTIQNNLYVDGELLFKVFTQIANKKKMQGVSYG